MEDTKPKQMDLETFAALEQRPGAILVAPTNRCDNDCRPCCRTKKTGDLRREGIELIVQQLRDPRIHQIFDTGNEARPVGITISGGGDPLMYPHLEQLTRSLVSYNHETVLLTSGLHLTAERLRGLRNTGLRQITLSLDVFRNLEYIASAIRNYLDVFPEGEGSLRLKVTRTEPANETLQRAYSLFPFGGRMQLGLQIDLFSTFARLIEAEEGAGKIDRPTKEGLVKRFHREVYGPGPFDMGDMQELECVGNATSLDKSLFRWNPLYHKVEGETFYTMQQQCGLYIISIEANGDIKPCCTTSSESEPLKLGNIFTTSIADALLGIQQNPIVRALFFERGIYTLIDAIKRGYVQSNFGPGEREKRAFVDRLLDGLYTGKCHCCSTILAAPEKYQLPEFLRANL